MKVSKTACGRFAAAYLRYMEPEAAARAAGLPGKGAELLCLPEVTQELERQKQARHALLGPEDVLRRLSELAFGQVNDCIRVAIDPQAVLDADTPPELSLISEIRRTDKGVELKLVDRVAALEKLMTLLGGNDEGAQAFFEAMQAVDSE